MKFRGAIFIGSKRFLKFVKKYFENDFDNMPQWLLYADFFSQGYWRMWVETMAENNCHKYLDIITEPDFDALSHLDAFYDDKK